MCQRQPFTCALAALGIQATPPTNRFLCFFHRLSADERYLIVAQLNINRIAILAAPPIGLIGDCEVVSTIQLAEEVKPHLVDVSMQTGAIYVAEIGARQVQKYVPVG